MDGQHILPHRTVLVRDGRIAAIGASDTFRLPNNATRIDGTGRFLIPGLVDMHSHFLRPPKNGKNEAAGFSDEPNYQKVNQSFALLFVANGVTTVRVTWGHAGTDEVNERIRHGEFLGPTIYSTGPITDGEKTAHPGARIVTTTEQARQAVRDDKAHGYIATKVYDDLTLEMYRAIVDEARLQHFPVVGHIPLSVSLDEAIRSHQVSIEHADSFLDDLQPDPSTSKGKKASELFADADVTKLATYGKTMKEAGIWTCPTIVVFQMDWHKEHVVDEMKYIPAEIADRYWKHWAEFQPVDGSVEIGYSLAVVRALHDAGAPLLAGSDAFKPNVVPGFSLLEELNYFVEAGLTPYEAIKAATSDPARFLQLGHEFGTVTVGQRADLLLVDANPLEDIHNLGKRSGVMVRGKWITENELQSALKKILSSQAR